MDKTGRGGIIGLLRTCFLMIIGAAPLILRRRDFLLSQAGAKERVDYA